VSNAKDELAVRSRVLSASLEPVGAILRRLAAENPEPWASLLAGRAEQEEAA
jgi:hypothetical protein